VVAGQDPWNFLSSCHTNETPQDISIPVKDKRDIFFEVIKILETLSLPLRVSWQQIETEFRYNKDLHGYLHGYDSGKLKKFISDGDEEHELLWIEKSFKKSESDKAESQVKMCVCVSLWSTLESTV
jgi:hypothetical protein